LTGILTLIYRCLSERKELADQLPFKIESKLSLLLSTDGPAQLTEVSPVPLPSTDRYMQLTEVSSVSLPSTDRSVQLAQASPGPLLSTDGHVQLTEASSVSLLLTDRPVSLLLHSLEATNALLLPTDLLQPAKALLVQTISRFPGILNFILEATVLALLKEKYQE
jgi:hypothetical protein